MIKMTNSNSDIPIVEEFHVFSKEEAEHLSYIEIVEASALIVMLWLQKHFFPESSLKLDTFKGDNTIITPKLVSAMQDFLKVLGEPTTLKKALRSGNIDINDFDVISKYLKERLVKLISGSKDEASIADTPEFCKAILQFRDIIMKLSSQVERIPIDKLAAHFFSFNKEEQIRQNSAPIDTLIKYDNCYFAAFVPEENRPKNGSDHITIAYGTEPKGRLAYLLGHKCTIIPNETLVWWNEEFDTNGNISYITLDEEPKIITKNTHAYLPVKIKYDLDDINSLGHISIHIEGGSQQHGLNHIHQFDVMNEDLKLSDMSKSFETLILPLPCGRDLNKESVYASFDFDKTLMAETSIHTDGEVNLANLRDASCITEEHLTPFGHFVRNLKIPMMITTSRRATSKEASEMTIAMKNIFPTCKMVSFGNKIISNNEDERAYMKARDKANRIRTQLLFLWHFDDEKVVATYRGFGTTIIDGTKLEVYLGNAMPPIHTTFTINGPVGAGKSTLIAYILEHGNYVVPGINDDNKSPLAVWCGADSYIPEHSMVPYDIFPTTYPDRETLLLYDTTGHGREGMSFTSIQLAGDMTAVNMVGCLSSIFQRADHPNLNGLFDIDLSASSTKVSPFDTNQMCLIDFHNHLWAILGNSPDIFKMVMNRIGQNCSFQLHGGKLHDMTKYNEGQQKWDAVWSRQNRNCDHMLVNNNHWISVKAGLETGAEMKPRSNSDDGDSYSKNRSAFQNEVCKRLFTAVKDLPRGSAITAKADGALIQTSYITGPYIKEVYESVINSDNEFAKILAEHTYKCLDGNGFILISTNGTFMAANHMWSYIVTAIMCDLDKYKDPIFMELISNSDTTILQIWKLLIIDFSQRELLMWEQLYKCSIIPANTNCSHQMEMICPNRTTYNNEVHTELACSYPFGGIYSLGFRYGNVYVPHFDVENILDNVGYNHPAFWQVYQPRNIMKMLSDLQRVSTDVNYTQEQFFHEHPYHNKNPLKYEVIDHEGFVLLVKTLQEKQYDYGKLKTMLYYLFHKPRDSTMSTLLELAYKLDLSYFPIVSILRETDKILKKVDFNQVFKSAVEAMQPFYPVADDDKLSPIDPSNKKDKVLARLHAFVHIRDSGDNNKLHRFLYGNDKDGNLAIAVYKAVMTNYSMEYLFNYIPLIGILGKHLTDKRRTFKKKMENSINVIRNIILSGLNEETSEKIRRHIINMKLTMPVINDDIMSFTSSIKMTQ
jgi:hypothetical protein